MNPPIATAPRLISPGAIMNSYNTFYWTLLMMVYCILSVLTSVATAEEEQVLCNQAIKRSACQVLEAHNATKPLSCSVLEDDICRNWEASCNDTQPPDFCTLPTYGSCLEAYNNKPSLPSGLYMIQLSDGSVEETYCDMNGMNCDGLQGGWTRIAFFDLTQPGATCPMGLRNASFFGFPPYCDAVTSDNGCNSVFFNTTRDPYSSVCGRLRGYQGGSVSAFRSPSVAIDEAYLDGVSITKGSPRSHIWSFAGGLFDSGTSSLNCPCNNGYSGEIPPSFVGTDYYCESGRAVGQSSAANDSLWDGNCASTEIDCCTDGQPWFTKTLVERSTEKIEARICKLEADDGEILIDLMEIYVR